MATEQEDVKVAGSSDANDVNAEGKSSAPGNENEDLDGDLFGDEDKKIPYKVFKERNSKLRETERELKSLQAKMEQRVSDELYKKEAELRREYEKKLESTKSAAQEVADDFGYDYQDSTSDNAYVKTLEAKIAKLEEAVTNVSTATERDRIKAKISDLKYEYPSLDEQHVYALKRARPDMSWEECAEVSHGHFDERMKSMWKNYVEKKKVAAKSKVLGAEGLRNLSPEERPKTLKEARRKVAEYFSD